jgi:peptidoglycan hydrolase-like protein with peptidoglycan-binding domain
MSLRTVEVMAIPVFSDSNPIMLGDRGEDVLFVQRRLQYHGLSVPNAETGSAWFGPVTDAATRTFQKSRGLIVDGKVGTKTGPALLAPPVSIAPGPTGPILAVAELPPSPVVESNGLWAGLALLVLIAITLSDDKGKRK